MLDVVDGAASVGELATEVHEEIGIPLETAQRRMTEMVELFAAGAAAPDVDAGRECGRGDRAA